MNQVFFFIVLISFVFAAWTGNMEAMGGAALSSAKVSVDISLGLVGYMALFLGLMKVGEEGGLLKLLARAIRPVMSRLFPEIPDGHPALPAMVLNIAANMLGLGNAATPLGIKAMHELNKLNERPGVASNAMVLFLAINTSGVALLPSGVVSFREQAGSTDPWGIVAPTLFATLCSTIVGITAAKTLQRLPIFAPPAAEEVEVGEVGELAERDLGEAVNEAAAALDEESSSFGVYALGAFLLVAAGLLVVPAIGAAFMTDLERASQWRDFAGTVGDWVIPVLILSLLAFGFASGVKVYEVFVAGAKEGFEIAVKIIPFLVAILVAVGMFKASGAMAAVLANVGGITMALGIPPEAVPMALVRPLSGSGASGVMAEVLNSSGPDSYAGYVVSVLNGSTETTFYVLAVYFGSVGVTRIRHAVFTGLAADITGVLATGFICMALYGHLIGEDAPLDANDNQIADVREDRGDALSGLPVELSAVACDWDLDAPLDPDEEACSARTITLLPDGTITSDGHAGTWRETTEEDGAHRFFLAFPTEDTASMRYSAWRLLPGDGERYCWEGAVEELRGGQAAGPGQGWSQWRQTGRWQGCAK